MCPWLATSSTRVQIEKKLPTFESFAQRKISGLASSSKRSPHETTEKLLEMMVHQASETVINIRDAFWKLLFFRESTDVCPPTPAEVCAIYEMYKNFLETTQLGSLIYYQDSGSALEACVADFVFPVLCCGLSSSSCHRSIRGPSKFSLKGINDLIHAMRHAEIVLLSASRFDCVYYGPREIALQSSIPFGTRKQGDYFVSLLSLSNYPSPGADKELEIMARKETPGYYEKYVGASSRISVYFKIPMPGGKSQWALLGCLPFPIEPDSEGSVYPSIARLHSDLLHRLSEARRVLQ